MCRHGGYGAHPFGQALPCVALRCAPDRLLSGPFRSCPVGGLLQGLNEDSVNVQAAISDKAGNFVHHVTTFVAGALAPGKLARGL
jgi:hypothetical protein